jgi:hypothetical protein
MVITSFDRETTELRRPLSPGAFGFANVAVHFLLHRIDESCDIRLCSLDFHVHATIHEISHEARDLELPRNLKD